MLDEDRDNLPFLTEHFLAHLLRARFYLDYDSGDGPEITRELQAIEEQSLQIYAQDPGNVTWRNNSVHIALTLAKLAKKRGDDSDFDHWLTIADERLRQLYRLPVSKIESLVARRDAGLFCLRNQEGRDWPWALPHYHAVMNLQLQICRQSEQMIHFHNMRRFIRSFVDELVLREGETAALSWLTEFSNLLQKESQAPTLSPVQKDRWHLAIAFNWGQRDRLGENGARKEASLNLLLALDQAEQLLSFQYLRPANRLELFDNLLAASTDRTLEHDLAKDTRLAELLRNGITLLPEERQAEATQRLLDGHRLPDGSYRQGYSNLATLESNNENED